MKTDALDVAVTQAKRYGVQAKKARLAGDLSLARSLIRKGGDVLRAYLSDPLMN